MAAEAAHILRKKEAILTLEKYLDHAVSVILKDFREITGILKGFDSNVNIVLGNAIERKATANRERKLGAAIIRGCTVATVTPCEGTVEVANAFEG